MVPDQISWRREEVPRPAKGIGEAGLGQKREWRSVAESRKAVTGHYLGQFGCPVRAFRSATISVT